MKSQKEKILDYLKAHEGEWINGGQVFLHQMWISQFHARIKELQDEDGYNIIASDFTDEHGYKSYKLVGELKQEALFEVPVPRLSRLDLVR